MPRGTKWTDEEDAVLVRYLRMGASYSEIAGILGDRSPQAVNKRARMFTDHELAHSRWSADMDASLRKLWASNVSMREIARRIGVCDDTVANRAAKLELPKRGRRIGTGSEGIRTASHAHETAKARKVRNDTIRFELHYCATAERCGWPIRGYAA